MHKELSVSIQGISPLVMHNLQLCDPFNEYTRAIKALTAKKAKKTDADAERISELEFKGGLYVDADGYPILPSQNLEGVLRDGAKNAKLGKTFTAAVFVEQDAPLQFAGGPLTGDELWSRPEFRFCTGVKVSQARVMRMRPIFRTWSAAFVIGYRDDMVNERSVLDALKHAGSAVGVMDYKPKFGRFEVSVK